MLKKAWTPIKSCIRHCTNVVFESYFVRNFPTTQCSVLSNGLTIATEERKTANVCMGFYIDSGSRYENESSNGLTHFFQHIAFKCTKKRQKSTLQNEISKTGAQFKCFTTREVTVYYVECLAQELPEAADILFDCIFNNPFVDAEIEMQKNVVYEELLQHDMSTGKVLYDYLHSTAFQGTALAHTVMGPSKNLNSFNSVNLSNHVAKMFIPQRIVLAAVGGIKHEFMVDLGEQYLSKIKCDEESISFGSKRYTGSQIIYRDDSIPVAHVAIAIEGPSFCDENRLVMELAKSIIGGWDSSQLGGINHGTRLAQVVSGGGLCDAYKAFNLYYQDTGLWGVEFISPKLEVDDMIMTIQEEWMRLCHMITDGILLRAKNELKSKILTKLQINSNTCHDIGHYILRTGCRPSIYDQLQAIDNITANDLKHICDKYIYDKCPVVVGIGSTECLLPYSKHRGYMYWLRI